ncbi:hypothetical protein KI688_005863 [Linnemannia hyalina]|uniref:Galactose oxidase n=1 Tax=Linnemannia hyalina TaxID=64524 RepID=A0A9P8BX72_9FUNG|nr:hypothetical protein KI688_005863 [Linnemannia hyalina]
MIQPKKATIGSMLSLTLSLTLLLSSHKTAYAQYTSINSASSAAYARYQNQFYVGGGGLEREIAGSFYTKPEATAGDGQFSVLDLSVPWAGSAPAWKKLAYGPKVLDFPFAMNANGTKAIAFRAVVNASDSFASIYEVATNTWKPSKIVAPKPDQDGIEAVLDPTSDKVYMAGGFEGDEKFDKMYVYLWETDELKKIEMPGRPLTQTLYYKAVWWTKQNSILFFGGYAKPSGAFVKPEINVYSPATDSWGNSLLTTGAGPGARSDMCMAISDDGTKLVVFGGRYFDTFHQYITGDIYVLDLDTMVWTRGPDYTTPRIYTTCTIVDGTFLSWGGSDSLSTVNSPIIIYDIKRNKYLSQYKGPDPDKDFDPLAPPKTSGSGSNGNSNNSDDKEMTFEERRNLILGCVFGGAALFWITVCCCICRVKRNRTYRVQEVLDAAERKIAEERESAAKRQTVSPAAAARVNGSATVNGKRVSVNNNNNNNRVSTTVRPAAIPTHVQSPGNQPYPLMQSPGSQPYPLMQSPGQIYPLLPQQQGYGQTYPMIPLQHQHQPGQIGAPQVYPMLQQQDQHRLSKPAAPLPHQHQPGGSPQVISSDPTNASMMMASPTSIYGSPYAPNPRGPELISVAQSDYAESHGGFAGSQTSFVGQSSSPASGSAADLIRSPQQRHN